MLRRLWRHRSFSRSGAPARRRSGMHSHARTDHCRLLYPRSRNVPRGRGKPELRQRFRGVGDGRTVGDGRGVAVAVIGSVGRIVGDERTAGGGPATRVVRAPAVGLGVGGGSDGLGVSNIRCCVGESASVGSTKDDSPLDGVVDARFKALGPNPKTSPAVSALAAALSTSVFDDAARTRLDRTRRTSTLVSYPS